MPTTLALMDPPGPLVLPHLMRCNEEPCSEDRLTLENALHDVLRAEEEIDQVLQIVKTRKEEYAKRAALLRQGLAPCRILPQEIWSRIFCDVMRDNGEFIMLKKLRGSVDDVTDQTSTQDLIGKGGKSVIGQLSLVCRMWRATVQHTPSLWRRLPSEIASESYDPAMANCDEGELAWRAQYNYAFRTHLSYAGSLPKLELCAIVPTRNLDLPANVEYLELLGEALPRLRFLDLGITAGNAALSRFSALPQNFDNLKTLMLTVFFEGNQEEPPAPPENPWMIFNHCPLLSQMKLHFLPSGGTPSFRPSLID